mgnify:FL=1|jgi:hypothetical protein
MNLLKKTFLSVFFAAGTTIAGAQSAAMTQAAQQFAEKIMQEAIQSIMMDSISSGKQPSQADISKKVMDIWRTHLDEFKQLTVSQCAQLYGADKNQNCQCVSDNTDYNAELNVMEKQLANMQLDPNAPEIKAMEKRNAATFQHCGLDYNVMRKAAEQALGNLQPPTIGEQK